MRCVCVFLPLSVRTAQWDTRAPQRAVRLTLAVYFRSVFFRTMSRTRWLVLRYCVVIRWRARARVLASARTQDGPFFDYSLSSFSWFSPLGFSCCLSVCECVYVFCSGALRLFSPSLSLLPCCTRLTVGALYTCGYLLLRTRRVFINEIDQ